MISPELLFWYELALKMALTALVVVITSVVVERSGPFIGALIAALPTAAGAAYAILAIEHPPSFIAASAIGSAATGAAVSIFALVYTVLAQRRGLVLSLGVALLVWFVAAALLRLVAWTPLSAAALNAVVFADHHSAELALSRFGTAEEIPPHRVRHSAARARRRHCGRRGDHGELQHRLVCIRHVCAVSDHFLLLHRHFASARRRQGDGQHGGACAGRFHRAGAGFLLPCIISPNRSAHGGRW